MIFQDFQRVVLDDLVLVVARKYRQDILTAAPDADFNRGNRHAAYRLWVQEIAESFQVAAFGKSGINSQMRLASTEALLEED